MTAGLEHLRAISMNVSKVIEYDTVIQKSHKWDFHGTVPPSKNIVWQYYNIYQVYIYYTSLSLCCLVVFVVLTERFCCIHLCPSNSSKNCASFHLPESLWTLGRLGFGSMFCGSWFMIVHAVHGWMMICWWMFDDSPTFETFNYETQLGEIMTCCFFFVIVWLHLMTAKEWGRQGKVGIVICICRYVYMMEFESASAFLDQFFKKRPTSANYTHSQLRKKCTGVIFNKFLHAPSVYSLYQHMIYNRAIFVKHSTNHKKYTLNETNSQSPWKSPFVCFGMTFLRWTPRMFNPPSMRPMMLGIGSNRMISHQEGMGDLKNNWDVYN